jgi:hypothetical protein
MFIIVVVVVFLFFFWNISANLREVFYCGLLNSSVLTNFALVVPVRHTQCMNELYVSLAHRLRNLRLMSGLGIPPKYGELAD